MNNLAFQLTIRIDELESKKQFKCTWVNGKLKEEACLRCYLCCDRLPCGHKANELIGNIAEGTSPVSR